jgi:hypothetical protein
MFITVSCLCYVTLIISEPSTILYSAICAKDLIACSATAGVQYLETYAKLIRRNKSTPKRDTNNSEGSKMLYGEDYKCNGLATSRGINVRISPQISIFILIRTDRMSFLHSKVTQADGCICKTIP